MSDRFQQAESQMKKREGETYEARKTRIYKINDLSELKNLEETLMSPNALA